jgi:hypothetical protein
MLCCFLWTHIMLSEKNFQLNLKHRGQNQVVENGVAESIIRSINLIQFFSNLSPQIRIFLMKAHNSFELSLMNYIEVYIQSTIDHLDNNEHETPSPEKIGGGGDSEMQE